MNTPNSTSKNPQPGSRPPGSPEDNTPILWEVGETKLHPGVLWDPTRALKTPSG